MIYIRLKPRALAKAGYPVYMRDIADILADARLSVNDMQIKAPNGTGIWQLDARQLRLQIQQKHPKETIRIIGEEFAFLYREPEGNRRIKPLQTKRSAAAGMLAGVLTGTLGALGLKWVWDLAAKEFPKELAARSLENPLFHTLLMAVPYIAGALAGFFVYFLLTEKRRNTLNKSKHAAFLQGTQGSAKKTMRTKGTL